jgi:tetratricopeptide (TPR) repeat protein
MLTFELVILATSQGQSARVLNNLGLAYHSSGLNDDAMEAYRKALVVDPTYNRGELQYNLGVSLMRVGRAQDAVESFQVSATSCPDTTTTAVAPNVGAFRLCRSNVPDIISPCSLQQKNR